VFSVCAEFHHALEPPFLGDDGGFHPLPLYGDGTTIDPADIEFADQIVNETRVLVPWQQGDMVILDVRILRMLMYESSPG